jgi:hypothetical protein
MSALSAFPRERHRPLLTFDTAVTSEGSAVIEESQPAHVPIFGDLRCGPAMVAVVVERNAAVGQQVKNNCTDLAVARDAA